MSYNIIGIDISLTGTAIAEKVPTQGFTAQTIACKGMDGLDRLEFIRNCLTHVKRDAHQHTKIIFVEGLAFNSNDGKASERHYLFYHLRLVNESGFFQPKIVPVPPTSLKKFATGRGNAKKDEMMLACYKLTGFDPADNNQADAVLLAHFGEVYMGLKEPKSQAQREAIEALKNPKPKKSVKRG